MKKIYIVVLFLVTLIQKNCNSVVIESIDMSIEELIKEGDKQHDNKNYKAAIECYKKAITAFKINVSQNRLILSQIYNNFGITLLQLKELNQTEVLYKESRRIRKELLLENPNNKKISQELGKIYHNIGILQMQQKNFKEAIRSFENSLKTEWKNNKESKDTQYCLKRATKEFEVIPKTKIKKRKDCLYCSKIFRVPAELKEHLTIHEKKKNLKCPFCLKKFSLNRHIKQHLLSHSGEKRFICYICKRGFTEKNKMERHQYNIHIKQKMVQNSKLVLEIS